MECGSQDYCDRTYQYPQQYSGLFHKVTPSHHEESFVRRSVERIQFQLLVLYSRGPSKTDCEYVLTLSFSTDREDESANKWVVAILLTRTSGSLCDSPDVSV